MVFISLPFSVYVFQFVSLSLTPFLSSAHTRAHDSEPYTQTNYKAMTPSTGLDAAAVSISDSSRAPGVYNSLASCWKFGPAIRISLFWMPYTCLL